MKIQRYRKWLYAAGCILLGAYFVVTYRLGEAAAAGQLCQGVFVQILDTARQNFVTAAELRNELGRLPDMARRTPVAQINTDSLAQVLRVIDKIESVEVNRLTDGSIHILVEPMRPVARIFEPDFSYYINKDGKRISADARYHVDVPVIQGFFNDTSFTALSLLPLVRFINENKRWSQLVTMIKVDSPRDVLLIPAIRGLVFNIGAPDGLPDKFVRLERMLTEVLPVKGWEYYDTLSVKWRGQVVATRRQKVVTDTLSTVEDFREADDIETMSVGDNVAAGQVFPGRKARSEKPIAGAGDNSAKKPADDAGGKPEKTGKEKKNSKESR